MNQETIHLNDMPNVGKILTQKLEEVGIKTPQALIEMGSEQAFLRIKTVDQGACLSMLQALEGAVQGVRWHHLDYNRKLELQAFYKRLHNLPIKLF